MRCLILERHPPVAVLSIADPACLAGHNDIDACVMFSRPASCPAGCPPSRSGSIPSTAVLAGDHAGQDG